MIALARSGRGLALSSLSHTCLNVFSTTGLSIIFQMTLLVVDYQNTLYTAPDISERFFRHIGRKAQRSQISGRAGFEN